MRNILIQRFLNKYFDQDTDFRAQVYHLLSMVGIAAGVGIAALALVVKESLGTAVIDCTVSVLSFVLLRIAYRKKCYHFCSWVFVVFAFWVLFPILFFVCGGYRSGAYVFIIAFSFTALLLEKSERNIALVVEGVLYISCCLISYYSPGTMAVLASEADYFLSMILNFVTASSIILIVLLMRTRIFRRKQEQIEEYNRELSARNETLAQYDDIKSDFLAAVAHEVNTPLTVISASGSDTMDLLAEEPLNMDEIIENQKVIVQETAFISNILLDLMDSVAIEKGRISLNRQPVKLAELLSALCGAQHKKLDENNNQVVCDLQHNLPKVWLDPLRIEQVMINLLSNAFRHTWEGNITIKLERSDAGQVVSVIDNGVGMDPEMARVALEQYVSTKSDHWRHGIGLYLCRRIILAHGGEIRIDSEKERGTTVSFLLKEDGGYV